MATYPKVIKPWRGYPSANVVMAIRTHVKQVGADSTLGQISLTKDRAVHIGTIPRGAIILPAIAHVITAFTATSTVMIGPNPTANTPSLGVKDAILTSAAIAPATIGFKPGLGAGVLMGFTANDLPLFILSEVLQAAAGEVDIIIPFYINRD